MSQGCHPDVVARIWDELGPGLLQDCRAQANGRPVLAHPHTDRIIAVARGTAYALWLAVEDRGAAADSGASSRMSWGGGSHTELAEQAGEEWIWGRWFAAEAAWLQRAYAAAGVSLSGGPPGGPAAA